MTYRLTKVQLDNIFDGKVVKVKSYKLILTFTRQISVGQNTWEEMHTVIDLNRDDTMYDIEQKINDFGKTFEFLNNKDFEKKQKEK